METITINYFAVVVGAVLSMAIGTVWYGPLFGKKWLEIIGATEDDLKKRKEMQKAAGLLYAIQFALTLFQVLVLAHLVADTIRVGSLERSLWIWAAFVVPTLAGSAMWTNEESRKKWARFLIQGGYQLTIFIVFGLLLEYWK